MFHTCKHLVGLDGSSSAKAVLWSALVAIALAGLPKCEGASSVLRRNAAALAGLRQDGACSEMFAFPATRSTAIADAGRRFETDTEFLRTHNVTNGMGAVKVDTGKRQNDW